MDPETAAAITADMEARKESETLEVWPENWQAVIVFCSAMTQWRVGFGGPTGLDYTAVESVMRMQRVRKRDRPDCLERIQVMEGEALTVFGESR